MKKFVVILTAIMMVNAHAFDGSRFKQAAEALEYSLMASDQSENTPTEAINSFKATVANLISEGATQTDIIHAMASYVQDGDSDGQWASTQIVETLNSGDANGLTMEEATSLFASKLQKKEQSGSNYRGWISWDAYWFWVTIAVVTVLALAASGGGHSSASYDNGGYYDCYYVDVYNGRYYVGSDYVCDYYYY